MFPSPKLGGSDLLQPGIFTLCPSCPSTRAVVGTHRLCFYVELSARVARDTGASPPWMAGRSSGYLTEHDAELALFETTRSACDSLEQQRQERPARVILLPNTPASLRCNRAIWATAALLHRSCNKGCRIEPICSPGEARDSRHRRFQTFALYRSSTSSQPSG